MLKIDLWEARKSGAMLLLVFRSALIVKRRFLMKEAQDLYNQLQAMYELMQREGYTEDVENAIFEYEDCVTEEQYAQWLEKYSYYR